MPAMQQVLRQLDAQRSVRSIYSLPQRHSWAGRELSESGKEVAMWLLLPVEWVDLGKPARHKHWFRDGHSWVVIRCSEVHRGCLISPKLCPNLSLCAGTSSWLHSHGPPEDSYNIGVDIPTVVTVSRLIHCGHGGVRTSWLMVWAL